MPPFRQPQICVLIRFARTVREDKSTAALDCAVNGLRKRGFGIVLFE